jgi:hypothetical protein
MSRTSAIVIFDATQSGGKPVPQARLCINQVLLSIQPWQSGIGGRHRFGYFNGDTAVGIDLSADGMARFTWAARKLEGARQVISETISSVPQQ